ncbi:MULTISPECIES: hypothetical protein [unclassified Shinella]|uniref:hypothetical protein n=1 Tax=unclassified Shinella TaxID=2643062 RepID=UPI00234F15D7|nr:MULTISPECIES: hypothetical protein [unclassified Shinella]MCO5140574.1 hypothetical protein [Shinella sp.]MDC7254702.1 hypothetical protein [Shinella sp. YE25]
MSFAAASCLKNRAQFIPVRPQLLAASPNRPVRAGKPINLDFLYLVLSLAANTKYSINSFFFPAQSDAVAFQENEREKTPAASGSSTRPHAHQTRFRDENRPRNITVQSPPQLEFINLIWPIPVKGWFVMEV